MASSETMFLCKVSSEGTVCAPTNLLPPSTKLYPTSEGIYALFQRSTGVAETLRMDGVKPVVTDKSPEQIRRLGPQVYTDMLAARGWYKGEVKLPRVQGEKSTLVAAECLGGVLVTMECLAPAMKDGRDNGFRLRVSSSQPSTIEIEVSCDGSWRILKDSLEEQSGTFFDDPR